MKESPKLLSLADSVDRGTRSYQLGGRTKMKSKTKLVFGSALMAGVISILASCC